MDRTRWRRTVARGDLLQHQSVGYRIYFGAVPLSGRGGPEDAEFAELNDDFRFDPQLFLPGGSLRGEAVLGELADHIEDEGVVVLHFRFTTETQRHKSADYHRASPPNAIFQE